MADLNKSQRLPADIETKIKEIVYQVVESGDYVDWVTLSSNLLFSAKYATSLEEFSAAGLYNNFIYFTSSKSQIIELCEWMGQHPDVGNPFAQATRQEVHQQLNYGSAYRDIMLHNLHSKVV